MDAALDDPTMPALDDEDAGSVHALPPCASMPLYNGDRRLNQK